MSDEQRLERIVGRIEGTINGMKKNMEKIERQNGEILKSLNKQITVCATTRQKFEDLAITQIEKREAITDDHEERLGALEESGVPNKTRKQINVNSIVTAINLLLTIVKSWLGIP
jgi:hypothetical protein